MSVPSRSIVDSLPLSGLPRVRAVLEAFPKRWFFTGCKTPAFSQQRARCDWSVPFGWSVVEYEPYNTDKSSALGDMRADMFLNMFRVRNSQPEQCIHWPQTTNNAFRAYHDYMHVLHACDFTASEEFTLADIVAAQECRETTAFVHWVETVCPIVGLHLIGDFPAQADCLTASEEAAIIQRYQDVYNVRL